MAKKSKTQRIAELENTVASYEELLKSYEKRENDLANAAEQDFVKSPSYVQMAERIRVLEKMTALSQYIATTTKKNAKKMDAAVRDIYEDNRRMVAESGSTEYFAGLTENQHPAEQYIALQEQILNLQATLETQNQLLEQKDAEIRRLQMLLSKR